MTCMKKARPKPLQWLKKPILWGRLSKKDWQNDYKKLLPCLIIFLLFSGCSFSSATIGMEQDKGVDALTSSKGNFTADARVVDVVNDESFDGFGRLIFPVDRQLGENMKLKDIGDIMLWYSNVSPQKTVEIVNYMREERLAEHQIFYPIYTEQEMKADPSKRNTGLFFFRGGPGNKVAILNAGGGFYYVGAMHDSFPHALELSKKGYNAFALIYRPDAQTACEDLARAIAFLHEHADELGIDMKNYSLWGGSAGARMAAWLGSLGTETFGERAYPRPAAVIMQYTGLSEVYGNEPPTYNCVGTSDGIAPYGVMEQRIQRIRANGTNAEIDIYPGLPHGFGLGEGTVAEGWINHAVTFWEKQN